MSGYRERDIAKAAEFFRLAPTQWLDLLFTMGRIEARRAMERWIAAMQDEGLAAATINRRLSAHKSVTKDARSRGIEAPVIEISGLPIERYEDTSGPPTYRVESAIRKRSEAGTIIGLRDAAIFALWNDMAIKRGSLASLDVESIDGDQVQVDRMYGRGHEWRRMTPRATEAVNAWLAVHPIGMGPLWVNFDHAKKGNGRLTGAALHYIAAKHIQAGPQRVRNTAINRTVATKGMRSARRISRLTDGNAVFKYDDNARATA